jgi:hypothetical protein
LARGGKQEKDRGIARLFAKAAAFLKLATQEVVD